MIHENFVDRYINLLCSLFVVCFAVKWIKDEHDPFTIVLNQWKYQILL